MASTATAAGVVFVLLAVAPAASAVSFDYASFDPDTKLTCSPGGRGICLQGDAFVNRGLQLTKNQLDGVITSSAGRAVYSDPVHIWDAATRRAADFTTRFSFIIHDVDPGNPSGDGLAFFLSPYPSAIPSNSSGGLLGLFPNSSHADAGRIEMVAVEFDTYGNREWDSGAEDHVGINIGSIRSATELRLEGGIKKRAIASVWVGYNATIQSLEIYIDYGESPVSNQGTPTLSLAVDLREVLPEYAAVGFSAATGFWVETHNILSWSFDSRIEIKKTGYPSSLKVALLVASALLGALCLEWLLMWFGRAAAGDRGRTKVWETEDGEGKLEDDEGKRAMVVHVDAEPLQEAAGSGGGRSEDDVDGGSTMITHERRGEDSSFEMAAGEAGDEEELRMKLRVDIDSSSSAGDEVMMDASVDVEPAGSSREDGEDDEIVSLGVISTVHSEDGGESDGEGTCSAAIPAVETDEDEMDLLESAVSEVGYGNGEGDAEEDNSVDTHLSMEELRSRSPTPEEDISGNVEREDDHCIDSRVGRAEEGEEAVAAMNFLERSSPEEIPYRMLASATEDFAEERMLGRGGFGAVYRGFLHTWGIDVAIKRLSEESVQGIKEYVSEVKIISQLRHRNLVKLIGWCHEEGKFLLVYEFMSNRSLDHHLFDGMSQLAWAARYKIVLGLANALLYLHEECEQYVVHRDVKSSNVLLDEKLEAKLGDFGLAKLFNHDISSLEVTQLAGTRGYMAPEYALMGKASKGSDVYSFGVVVLETACGLRSVQVARDSSGEGGSTAMLLVEGVWDLYGKGTILAAADKRLGGEFDPQLMERLLMVGLWCAHPDLNQRPTISQARLALLFSKTVPVPVLPPKMPPWAYPLDPSPGETQRPPVDELSSSKKPPPSSRSLFSRFVLWWRRRRARNPRKITDEEIRLETDEIRMGTGMREFSYEELHRATGGFATDREIGENSYCVMYRARLQVSGGDATVKRFLRPHGQGKQWYIGEMMTLSHLTHKNLVKLLGWCHQGEEFLLVVEYTANGNLGRHLFGGRGSTTIPWEVRYKVAIGVASALCFLHDWGLCVLHRDIKSENVMLDEEFGPKLGGFELSRVVDHDDSSLVTTVVAGTMGYMAPEYAISGTYTKESDVYSFGGVAMEIACGRMIIDRRLPAEKEHLLRWVQKCSKRGRLMEAVDPKLEGAFNQEEMERLMVVGLWCSSNEPTSRPPMARVLRALQFKERPPRLLPPGSA